MIYFLLYNAGLELLDVLPEKMLLHSAIKNDLKKRNKKPSNSIIDLAVHQSAFYSNDQDNRGRPDIVHHCLLQFLFSSLVHPKFDNDKNFNVQLFIHTISNAYFEVPPTWRVPSHYFRFRGLMEVLLSKKQLKVSATENILLQFGNVPQIIDKLGIQKIILFTSHGKESEYLKLKDNLKNYFKSTEKILFLIGAYQHGETAKIISSLDKTKITNITFPGGRLPAWKVLSTIISILELS